MKKALFVIMAGLVLTAAVANANPINTRPVTTLNGQLQNLFNDITVPPPTPAVPIDASQQSPFALFVPHATGTMATTIVQLVGGTADQTFGIYEASNPNNRAVVLNGSAGTGLTAGIGFMDGKVYVNMVEVASNFTGPFGFFLSMGTNGPVYFSEDSLNGGDARALLYQGAGQTVQVTPLSTPGLFESDDYIVAFDTDSQLAPGANYTDFVAMVDSISPVPAPAAAFLGLIGLGLVRLYKRRAA